MKQYRFTIRILLIFLLLAGAANQAWAKKITYHILTKPFDVGNGNNSGYKWQNIRVEALQCTSEASTVGLPDQFISPLATNFQYWKSATSTYDKLYDSDYNPKIITTILYIYQCTVDNPYACLSNKITNPGETSSDDSDIPSDIYVTYDYIGDNNLLKLDGNTNYNVSITSGDKLKFMCYNRSRNNRVANANSGALSGEHLANDDFVIPEEGTADNQLSFNYGKWGPIGVFLGFKFSSPSVPDPYNFTIMTSYAGSELHITDKITNVDNTGTIKPYAGSTLMSKVGATSLWFDCSYDRHYKLESGISSAGQWTAEKYAQCKQTFYSKEPHERYDTWVGFYRYETPTMNTYALLPHPNGNGYIIVGSKMNQGDNKSTKPTINQPNSSGHYYTYLDYYDNNESGAKGKRRSQPYFKLQALSNALPTNFYEIRTYRLHVVTHGSSTTLTKEIKWSDAKASEQIVNHVPDALNRKYVKFTKAYTDAGKNNEVSTFAEARDAGKYEIWLDYETSSTLPFEVLPEGGDYKNARWYTMRVNGKAEQKNIAYHYHYSDPSSDQFITGSSSIGSESDLHQGEIYNNSSSTMVAFMGDPYELKIISRAASEDASTNRYIGCATGAADGATLSTTMTGTSDISKWEIMYESADPGNFVLRQFNTAANPKYIGWSSTGDKPVIYSSDSTRIRVVPLNKVPYTYYIMRNNDGDIAVKATVNQDVGKMLNSWQDIPDVIRSPFLAPSYTATVTYYHTEADAEGETNPQTNAPYNAAGGSIYVRYAFDEESDSRPKAADFNVILNNRYIYTSSDTEDNTIYTQESITTGVGSQAEDPRFQWNLDYSDPYHMTITNKGKGKYVSFSSWGNGQEITWSDTPSYFIAKSGSLPRTFEVMAATGNASGAPDASTTYYNIGRPADNTVKLYDNSATGYLQGNQVLRFQLIGTTATQITYHLIDKAGKELLQAVTRQASTDPVAFPPEYYSPLVSTYYYYKYEDFTVSDGTYTLITPKSDELTHASVGDIYVTYDVNDLVDLKRGKLYRLKYEAGQYFHQEDGSDGVNKTAQKAYYPYVNGDCNFFVYGDEQYEVQKHASSTRTRWVWYLQSDYGDRGDPYHVMIRSFQTESYPIANSKDYNAFFATYKPEGYDQVVTTLVWPGISGETATDYMVLGSEGQYQLVTTYKVDVNGDGDTDDAEDERRPVDSFEQYWKTFDTIRKKIYNESSAKEDDDDPITIPLDAKAKFGSSTSKTLRDSLTTDLGWHSYEKWAYAKRWNGYNNGYSSTEGVHEKKKGWEKIEHWYQTVDMGQGYFDFVETSIDPVLILLDQHGWEIMRKPLPSSPDDKDKNAKYQAIRAYNSPMVKEYAFWATAKKRTGLHQYYLLSDRIGGDTFTSTDLTNLPPYGSKNVMDKRGNLNDQYVTYIVKDEYAMTYNPKNKEAKPFLIEQGTKYATTTDGTDIVTVDVPDDGMEKYIIDHITDIGPTNTWYVKPNGDIDNEMGYGDVTHTWTDKKDDGSWKNKNPNAYEHYKYKDAITAQYISDKDSLGYFAFSNGFDPYNIQISSVKDNTKYMKTNADGMNLVDGIMYGTYPADPGPQISMGGTTPTVTAKWYDDRNLAITNTTWMAVQDAAGNMQLMPRFDQDVRMSEFGTLMAPTNAEVAKTYTKLYRPVIYDYRIIDNSGKESLRYKSGGDLLPQTPDHFKSPLATNFTYFAKATYDGETGTYGDIKNEIDGALDGATLENNTIYVRYEYNEEADDQKILMGNWQTMQLNNLDTKYDNGIKAGTKPATINSSEKAWQWKFLETPQSSPDPYAVKIFNRSKTDGTVMDKRFALLSHTSGDYALAEAGKGTYTYDFLNGNGLSTSTAATISTEAGFTCSAGTFSETKSQVKFIDDVEHTFTYKVYTNSGAFAISASQDNETVKTNGYVPTLPSNIKSPLLLKEQYLYYSKGDYEKPDTVGKSLPYLYGLYDDEVVVRYTPYNPLVTEYLVPNVRNATSETIVAKGIGSNDAPIDINNELLYNIIWYNDNMMTSTDGDVLSYKENANLQSDTKHEWKFEGDDPYAIKIKNKFHERHIYSSDEATCSLSENGATTFMLLPRNDNFEYGMFQKTGTAKRLSGYGQTLTDSDTPTKFIIFALATHQVIYHLMIKNIGEKVIIPYKEPQTLETENVSVSPKFIRPGTTQRDLKTKDSSSGGEGHIDGDLYQLGESLKAIGQRAGNTTGLFARDSIYCYDAGQISLGDVLEVPSAFYRPNVVYDFFVEGVYSANGSSEVAAMNTKYKGLNLKRENQDKARMGDDSDLLGTTVFINIVYSFNGALDTNSGNDFVTDVTTNKWYALETSDATPKLAQFTNAWGMKLLDGRESHYTNDYLWSPVGDPYGFKLYNRYIYKTDAVTNKVLTTSSIVTGAEFMMDTPEDNHNANRDIYELLSSNTPGYFRIQAMKKTDDGKYLYFYKVQDGSDWKVKLNTNATEFTFNLSKEMLKPYYDRAGYVGGLKPEAKTLYEAAGDDLMAIQNIVYNDANIVPFIPGYYRLHSPVSATSIKEERYASGYTHAIERDLDGNGSEADAIPLHFYERKSAGARTYKEDLVSGYTESAATRGDLPVPEVENDPASIFYFPGGSTNATGHPLSTMSTQGLYVAAKANGDAANGTTDSKSQQAVMSNNSENAITFCLMDIGGAMFLIHDNESPSVRRYLNYDQSDPRNIYDLKYYHNTPTDDARWCLQPVQKGAKAGDNEMGLKLSTNSGGDSHYYASFCAPFDVLLTEEKKDTAWVVPPGGWNTELMHPKMIGEYNTGTYAGNNQFIPAGTPVIIRTKSATGYVTLALPTTTPTASVPCIFTGKYLEQMLTQGSDYVYVFGQPYAGSDDESFATNGTVTMGGQDSKIVGFYKNANFYREQNQFKPWPRNNKYVYANKIYYRSPGGGGSSASREFTRGIEFIPVIFDMDFDVEEGDEESGEQQRTVTGDGRIYDLQGRCVATRQQVEDGSWRTTLAPGIYILNGKKFKK